MFPAAWLSGRSQPSPTPSKFHGKIGMAQCLRQSVLINPRNWTLVLQTKVGAGICPAKETVWAILLPACSDNKALSQTCEYNEKKQNKAGAKVLTYCNAYYIPVPDPTRGRVDTSPDHAVKGHILHGSGEFSLSWCSFQPDCCPLPKTAKRPRQKEKG